MEVQLPTASSLAMTVEETARASGLGKTTIHALIKSGELASVKVGRRRLVRTSSLRVLLGEAA